MIKIVNHLGTVEISENYFINLIGSTVTNCFGVAGMSETGPTQGIRNYLKTMSRLPFKKISRKGINLKIKGSELSIEIHIIVSYGTNISAVVSSVTQKVSYAVAEATGFNVSNISVYVDGMTEN